MKTSILAASRVASAITEIAVRNVDATRAPVVVLGDTDQIQMLDVIGVVGGGLGYAVIHIDANDIKPADLSPRAQTYREIMDRVGRRAAPPLFVVDVTERAALHLDDDQGQVLALLALMSSAHWDGQRCGGLVVVTAGDVSEVARSLGTSLKRDDWEDTKVLHL